MKDEEENDSYAMLKRSMTEVLVNVLLYPSSTSGRCHLHGGKSPKGMDSPHYKDGNRSKYAKQQVLDRIQSFIDND